VSSTISKKSDKQFALVLIKHRLWGNIFQPYMFVSEPGKEFFRLSDPLSPYQPQETMKYLGAEERELVSIINEYTDRELFKLFSRNKNVKDFLSDVTPDLIIRLIRPYIERRMIKCFLRAREEGIICFRKALGSNIIHFNDMVKLEDEQAVPLFVFNRDPEVSTYKLQIEAGGHPVELFHNDIEIMTDSPCLIREGGRLLLITDIDASKLRPFLAREHIDIPKESEVKYYSKFVLNTVNKFRVKGSGFRIIEQIPEKSAHLTLEQSIRGFAVIILGFYYSGNYVNSEETSKAITKFITDGEEFTFYKYRRDFDWEQGCRDLLTSFGFITDDNINFYVQGEEVSLPDESILLIIENINRVYDDLTESGFSISQRNLNRNYSLTPLNIEITSAIANDWFDIRAVIRIGNLEIPFIRFRQNILEGIREYKLPDGSIAILPTEWFTKYRNLFELGECNEEIIRLHKQHFPILSEISDNGDPDIFEQLEKLLIPEMLPVQSKPVGLNCKMRDYQIKGLNWLYWLQSSGLGGFLADDMGLGKTVQALAILQSNIENRAGRQKETPVILNLTLFDIPAPKFTSLIIVPATLVFNWENEIKRFAPGMKVYSHTGMNRARSASEFGQYDIVISNYHIVRQDVLLLCSFRFHYIILDESQYVKNPGSVIYKCVTSLRSDFRLALSGTPIENSLTDLWAQLNFLNQGLLGNLTYFRREFVRPVEKLHDQEKEDRLKKLIEPFILRRTKEMVSEALPPLTEQTVYCDMTDEQGKIYEEEKSAVRNLLLSGMSGDKQGKSAIVVLQALMRLRQISCHPMLADEVYTGSSGKFEAVLNDIENVVSEGHKILLFSSFVMHLKLFASALEKKKTGFSILTGASTDRAGIVKEFQNDQGKKVFLISLKAGGLGLNLTSADYVFITDPWWNPAAEMQALSRAHRTGQERSVFVYRFISTGTLEEKIIKLQESKSKLAGSFIRSTDPLKDININQILDIIG